MSIYKPECFRLSFKVKECVDIALWGEGGVLPIMAYTAGLRPTGASFSGFRKGVTPLIPNTKFPY